MYSETERTLGQWLTQFPWSHLGVLTFRHPTDEWRARDKLQRWIRNLEKINQTRVNWFYALEHHKSQFSHIHLLLGSIRPDLPTSYILGTWRHDYRSTLERFNADKLAGTTYSTKATDSVYWDVNLKHFDTSAEKQAI